MAKKTKGNKSKNNANKNANHPKGKYDHLPFVSICTPTYNRRPFWPMAIKCFENYDYPKERMEWIIVDDGSDPIRDLVEHIPQVKYYREEHQMILGRKRNYMHEKTIGDIIVYQDDDDYYPPDRVSHAVEKLMSDPKILAGGSSILFLYFKHISQMYRFGPYGPNHATAGTFAFKRELLKQSKYDDFKAIAEERDFLKGYTVPFVQFDPLKTILVFSHNHNTFDKRELLQHAPNPTCVPDQNITVESIVKCQDIYDFFMKDIDSKLEAYAAGDVKNKPEVLEQIKNIKELREKQRLDQEEIRKKTLADDDVKHVLADAQNRIKEAEDKANKILNVNCQLIKRMKLLNEKVKGLNIDSNTMKLIDEEVKQPVVKSIRIKDLCFRVIQDDERSHVGKETVDNICKFINSNQIAMKIVINEKEEYPCEHPNIPIGFAPHQSQMVHYVQNQQPQVNLAAAQNSIQVSNEDVQTVIEQTGCNIATAQKALVAENGDIIACIMNIDRYKCDDIVSPPVSSINVSNEDVQTIIEQTGCNIATAQKALDAENGDVISCIMNIDSYKCDDNESPSDSSTSNSKTPPPIETVDLVIGE